MASPELTDDVVDEEGDEDKPREKLNLEVNIAKPSACERHVTVTVSREDLDRYFNEVFGELTPKAEVPGFRTGRAPRKLVEHRFRKDVAEQVKGKVLMDSIAQVTEEQKLTAISEPDLDPGAVEVPDEGPLTFEFDIEVRPEFDMPKWQGLKIERPVREFTSADIDEQLQRLLARYGRLVPSNVAADVGDYVVVNVTFLDGEKIVAEIKEQTLCVRPVLSFRDGKIVKFDQLMKGVTGGETRQSEAQISDDAPNAEMRGKTVTAKFEVLDVKRLRLPELSADLLQELGRFDSEGDLRDALKGELQRQLHYHQQQRARQQITAALTAAANWELPPDLLKRQARRELERSVLELRRSGFSDEQIRAHENELRQNTQVSTARLLKEHFILERIAEDEKISDDPDDYDAEIKLIAQQSGESPRRVRAQLEKRDLMDILRNQIVERKTIDRVLSKATFTDVQFKPATVEVEAVDASCGGEDHGGEIPEAKYSGQQETLPAFKERD